MVIEKVPEKWIYTCDRCSDVNQSAVELGYSRPPDWAVVKVHRDLDPVGDPLLCGRCLAALDKFLEGEQIYEEPEVVDAAPEALSPSRKIVAKDAIGG